MNCWDILGIAETNSNAAVKQAYAARLKITRPDDDAAAYQLLRDAYQYALQQIEKNPEKEKKAETEPVVAADVIEASVISEPSGLRPEQFVGQVFQNWDIEQSDTLTPYWPMLRTRLERTPLDLASEFSNVAACMVLGYPKLPVKFVEQLSLYFGWTRDFKLVQQLGSDRASELLARLDRLAFELKALHLKAEMDREAAVQARQQAQEAEHRRVSAIQQQYPRAPQFASLVAAAGASVATRCAFLAGPALTREWTSLTADEREVLHISSDTYEQGIDILRQGAQFRVVLSTLAALGAAILSWQLGTVQAYAALLLLIFGLCYLLPIGAWHESFRKFLAPTNVTRRLFTDGVRDPRLARFYSIIYAGTAASICLPSKFMTSDSSYPWGIVFLGSLLLWLSWITPPDEDFPAIKIAPAIFSLCVMACWALEVGGILSIISASAIWQALSYNARKRAGFGFACIIWLLTCVVLYTSRSSLPITVAYLGVPWLLFTLSRKVSVATTFSLMFISVIFTPFPAETMQMAWTGMVAIAGWMICSAMHWWGKRDLSRWMIYQQKWSDSPR